MHLNDSVGKCSELNYFCNHHEQASAIAAEGYARVSHRMGVVIVTSGPGGLNTLTGVMGQWTDSVPVLYISGQVKFETIEPAEQRVRLYGTTAVITGRTQMSGLLGGAPFAASSRYTHVYVMQQNEWRLATAQGTQILSPPA